MEYKPVYIEWMDTIAADSAWSTLEDYTKWADNEDWIIKQVSFIIEETDKYLLLAGKVNPQSENSRFSEVTKLPKSAIVKRLDLPIYS